MGHRRVKKGVTRDAPRPARSLQSLPGILKARLHDTIATVSKVRSGALQQTTQWQSTTEPLELLPIARNQLQATRHEHNSKMD
jgi:hypothetical protein